MCIRDRCIPRWYARYTGCPHGPETLEQWRRAPEAFLAAAVNGAVFQDPLGVFSAVRERLLAFYPEDVLSLIHISNRAKMTAMTLPRDFHLIPLAM